MAPDPTRKQIADLIEQLRPTDSHDWYEVAKSLHALGPAAIPPLIESLRDPEMRHPAIVALGLFGSDAAPAVPFVVPFLFSETLFDSVPDAASSMLAAVGPAAVAPLIARLAEAGDLEYGHCQRAFSQMKADDVLSALVECLASSNVLVRCRACKLLSYFGRERPETTAKLIERLSDPDAGVRDAAASALSDAPSTHVLEAYAAGGSVVREGCVKALTHSYTFRNADNVSFFNSAMQDDAPRVRLAAANGLMQLSAELARNCLEKELKEVDSKVRIEALRICRHHGGAATMSWLASSVRPLLWRDDPAVRREAALTLAACDWYYNEQHTRLVARILNEALRDANNANRAKYLKSLGRTSGGKDLLIPAIVECVRSSDRGVATAAAEALGSFALPEESAIASLVEALDSSDYFLRDAAVTALGRIGPVSARALPRLIEILRTGEHLGTVLLTLERFGPAAAPALDDVVKVIGRRTEHAPYVLASIGTDEAILELCKSIESYGYGDRKDFDASQGAMRRIAERARPFLEAQFQVAKPGQFQNLLAGLEAILEPEEMAPFIVQTLERGNVRDRWRALHYLQHWQIPEHFIKLPGALDRLLAMLDASDLYVRVTALEAFAECHEQLPVLADAYRDRVLICFRRCMRETGDDYQIRDLRRAAEKLGLETDET